MPHSRIRKAPNLELKAFPIDGRLVVLPPDTDENGSRNGKQASAPMS